MIRALFIAPQSQAKQQAVDQLHLEAQQGIVGDRYFGQSDHNHVTLIEYEQLTELNHLTGHHYPIETTRRNIITQHIRLNDLVGHTFTIGDVQLMGTELCQPCKWLSEELANTSVSPQDIMTLLLNKGGLRATVLNSGVITHASLFRSELN